MNLRRALSDHWHRFDLRRRARPGFALISNNCWGSGFYQDLGLAYNTPFIGTLVPPQCYLRLLADLPGHLAHPLRFIPRTRYPWDHRYPVATLGDVEIHFMHYADAATAEAAWTRRLARFPHDPAAWRVKFCDHHVALDPAHAAPLLQAFDALPFPRKICLLGRKIPALTCGVLLRESLPAGRVPDGHAAYRPSLRSFDAPAWLNA